MWPECIKVDPLISLERASISHAVELYSVIIANQAHLSEWLPWPDSTNSIDDTLQFIRSADNQYSEGNGVHYVIKNSNEIVGVVGFYEIDKTSKVGKLGYWLVKDSQGHGIMTRACRQVTNEALYNQSLKRIVIGCAAGNFKSRKIPESNGYKLLGISKNIENLHGKFIDHAIYVIERD